MEKSELKQVVVLIFIGKNQRFLLLLIFIYSASNLRTHRFAILFWFFDQYDLVLLM